MGQTNDNIQNNLAHEDASLPKQPGFVSFQIPKDQEFYFRFNGENGAPVLFSEGYVKEASRDNGIQSVLKNADNPKRYKLMEEDGRWYIALRAGNHQEIGRTRAFPKKTEANKKKKWLTKNLVPIHEGRLGNTEEGITSSKKAAVDPKGAGLLSNDPKYAFRIDIYPRQEELPAGVITNILNNNNKKFRGIDGTAITNFISGSMSDKDRSMLPKPEAGKKELVPKKEKAGGQERAIAPPKVENMTLEIVESPVSGHLGNWATGEFINIRLKVKDGVEGPSSKKVKMNLHFYPLQNPELETQIITEVAFDNGRSAFLPQLQQLKVPGIYRLRAFGNESSPDCAMLYATRAVHVYDCPDC